MDNKESGKEGKGKSPPSSRPSKPSDLNLETIAVTTVQGGSQESPSPLLSSPNADTKPLTGRVKTFGGSGSSKPSTPAPVRSSTTLPRLPSESSAKPQATPPVAPAPAVAKLKRTGKLPPISVDTPSSSKSKRTSQGDRPVHIDMAESEEDSEPEQGQTGTSLTHAASLHEMAARSKNERVAAMKEEAEGVMKSIGSLIGNSLGSMKSKEHLGDPAGTSGGMKGMGSKTDLRQKSGLLISVTPNVLATSLVEPSKNENAAVASSTTPVAIVVTDAAHVVPVISVSAEDQDKDDESKRDGSDSEGSTVSQDDTMSPEQEAKMMLAVRVQAARRPSIGVLLGSNPIDASGSTPSSIQQAVPTEGTPSTPSSTTTETTVSRPVPASILVNRKGSVTFDSRGDMVTSQKLPGIVESDVDDDTKKIHKKKFPSGMMDGGGGPPGRGGDGPPAGLMTRRASHKNGMVGPKPVESQDPSKLSWAALLLLSAKAIGNIFGDVGISPFFVYHATFHDLIYANLAPGAKPKYAEMVSVDMLVGVLSCIVWIATLVVSIKYVTLLVMADNGGEGGVFALVSLLTERIPISPRYRGIRIFVLCIAFLGASFIIGDGIVAPAISVLAALEGFITLAPDNHTLESIIQPVTLVILLILFFAQQYGVDRLSILFVPVMLIWFGFLISVGIYNLTISDAETLAVIAQAFNPVKAIELLSGKYATEQLPYTAFALMGALVLSVTGVEALYAELGSFTRNPIRVSWFFVVFPALMINYFGQVACMIRDRSIVANPFFLSIPSEVRLFGVILGALASIIASQGAISGSFSLLNQAISLRYFPPVSKRHTSNSTEGQVYVPIMNWFLMIGSLGLVISYNSSLDLARIYGVATASAMFFTTILYILVHIYVWKSPWYIIAAYSVVFLVLDGTFLVSNLLKVMQGGWITLVLGALFGFIIWIWYSTSLELNAKLKKTAVFSDQLTKWIKYQKVVLEKQFESEAARLAFMRQRQRMERRESSIAIGLLPAPNAAAGVGRPRLTSKDSILRKKSSRAAEISAIAAAAVAAMAETSAVTGRRASLSPTSGPNSPTGRKMSTASFLSEDSNIPTRVLTLSRTGGTGIYIDTQQNSDGNLSPHKNLSKKKTDIPAVLTSFISRIPVLPETIILLSVQFLPIPFISEDDRMVIRPLDEQLGVYRVIVNHGYQEMEVDIIGVLERARGTGIPKLDTQNCIFFVGKTSVQTNEERDTMSPTETAWFHKVLDVIRQFRITWFEMLNKNIDGQKELFHLPPEQTIEVGNTVIL